MWIYNNNNITSSTAKINGSLYNFIIPKSDNNPLAANTLYQIIKYKNKPEYKDTAYNFIKSAFEQSHITDNIALCIDGFGEYYITYLSDVPNGYKLVIIKPFAGGNIYIQNYTPDSDQHLIIQYNGEEYSIVEDTITLNWYAESGGR